MHVRLRACLSIWPYRDSQSIVGRDAYATALLSPLNSSLGHTFANKIKGINSCVTPFHRRRYAQFLIYAFNDIMFVSHAYISFLRSVSLSKLVKKVKSVNRIQHAQKGLSFNCFQDCLNTHHPLLMMPAPQQLQNRSRSCSRSILHTHKCGATNCINFAPMSVLPAERNYLRLDKGGLSLVLRLPNQISCVNDQSLLIGLLNEQRPIYQQASSRLERWALIRQVMTTSFAIAAVRPCHDSL